MMEGMKTLTHIVSPGRLGWPFSAAESTLAAASSPLGWPQPDPREPVVSRETSPERVTPEEIIPDEASPEQASPVQASPEQTSPELASPEQTSPSTPSTPEPANPSRIQPAAGAAEHVSPEPPEEVSRETSATAATDLQPTHTRILTVANQKGGVGKTTTAVNMAAALAQLGLRVLVIDMDPQGNASTALGVSHAPEDAGVYDVLIDDVPLAEVLVESPHLPGLWCAPATVDLAGSEIELVPMVARESRLRRAVQTFLSETDATQQRFDYVFIDCPPSLGLLTVNSFVAGTEVLIPIQCEYYALEGLTQLLRNIDLIKEHLNPGLQVSHILLTMYDGRTRLSAQVADEVRSHFPGQVLRTSIPRSVRISEAPSHGETVITYDPISSGALCYLEAAKEVARAAGRTEHSTSE